LNLLSTSLGGVLVMHFLMTTMAKMMAQSASLCIQLAAMQMQVDRQIEDDFCELLEHREL
jgi:hypothetical protein